MNSSKDKLWPNYYFFQFLALSPLLAIITMKFLDANFWNIVLPIILISLVYNIATKKLIIPNYIRWFFIFTCFTILSDAFLVKANVFRFEYFMKNKFILTTFLFLITENTCLLPQQFNRYIKLNYIVFGLGFILLLYQAFLDITFFGLYDIGVSGKTMDFTEQRLGSFYYALSIVEIGFLPFAIIAFQSSIFLNGKQKKKAYFLFAIGVVISLLNKSRWVMLNMLIVITGAITKFRFASIKNIIKLSATGLGLAVVLYVLYFQYTPFTKIVDKRILDLDKGGIEHGSAGTRLLAFEIFRKLYPENPIFGKGYMHRRSDLKFDTTDKDLDVLLKGRSSQIHVGFLSLFYYYGLVGGIIYLIFLFSLFIKLNKDYKVHGNITPLSIYISFIAANLTLVSIPLTIIGVIFSLMINKQLKLTNSLKIEGQLISEIKSQ